jgi:hypothetical protein
MLAARKEGVVPSPNGIANRRACAELLALKAHEQGVRNGYRRLSGAGGGPRSAPIRGLSAEAVREAASLLESLGHQVQEKRDRGRGGLADNFSRVWIAQTGDEVHR